MLDRAKREVVHLGKTRLGILLVVQWSRLHLEIQEVWAQSLVRKLSLCATTTKSALYSLCAARREATTLRSPYNEE